MISLIASTTWLHSSAKFLISSATTANPFPASPALAASIEALSANRLVCLAIPVMAFKIHQYVQSYFLALIHYLNLLQLLQLFLAFVDSYLQL